MKQTAYFAQALLLELVQGQYDYDIVMENMQTFMESNADDEEFLLMAEIFGEFAKENEDLTPDPHLITAMLEARVTDTFRFSNTYEEVFG